MDVPSPDNHTFAWDGIRFVPPTRWELASHQLRKGVTRITMEDEARPRLELEWVRPKTLPDRDKARTRFAKLTKNLTAAAGDVAEIDGLPHAWSAFRYAMPEKRTLVLAYYTPAERGDPMCFLRMHFLPDAKEAPTPTLRNILQSFELQRDPLWEWTFYDVDFTLDSRFKLTATSLQAGRKMLLFERGLRRFYVWHVSLADIILRKTTMEAWCAEFLNGFRAIRGPRFTVESGRLTARRTRWRPFGHYEEIGRWCFRYALGCRHLPSRNQIVFWVYNCRTQEDLARFPEQFPLAAQSSPEPEFPPTNP